MAWSNTTLSFLTVYNHHEETNDINSIKADISQKQEMTQPSLLEHNSICKIYKWLTYNYGYYRRRKHLPRPCTKHPSNKIAAGKQSSVFVKSPPCHRNYNIKRTSVMLVFKRISRYQSTTPFRSTNVYRSSFSSLWSSVQAFQVLIFLANSIQGLSLLRPIQPPFAKFYSVAISRWLERTLHFFLSCASLVTHHISFNSHLNNHITYSNLCLPLRCLPFNDPSSLTNLGCLKTCLSNNL